jgi:SNF2 family DNA or RNA helicase
MNSSVPHPSYCTNIQVLPGISGFKSTAKIEKLVSWVKTVPEGDKGIIFSFFEGALDLIEGVLIEDLGINCARLDSDLGPEEQAADLLRFKESSDCQFLLTTVQSCGSGLNIEEANHIAFLDRWFDTSIHQQAINTCHNINQTKPVSVVYFDAAITVDEVRKRRCH